MEAVIDVAALAVEQMRAVRRHVDAKAAFQAAREAWLAGAQWDPAAARDLRHARRDLDAANRAYEAACDAVTLDVDDGQTSLFDA